MVVPEVMDTFEVLVGRGVEDPFDVEEHSRGRTHQARLQRGVKVQTIGFEACQRGEGVHLGVSHEVSAECPRLRRRLVDTIASDGHHGGRLRVDKDRTDSEAATAK